MKSLGLSAGVLFSVILCSSSLFSQNVVFEKKYSSNLDCKEYYGQLALAVNYFKCFGDKLLKYHENGIKLINSNGEILWEKEINPLKKSSSKEPNEFFVCSKGEFVYLIQTGDKLLSSEIPLIIFKIHESGEIKEKQLNGSEYINYLNSFDNINNELVIGFSGNNVEDKATVGFIVLGEELKIKKGPVFLKSKEENQNNNLFSYRWRYLGQESGKIKYQSIFHNNEGSYRQERGITGDNQDMKIDAFVDDQLNIDYKESPFLYYPFKSAYPNSLGTLPSDISIEVMPTKHDNLINFETPLMFGRSQGFKEFYVSRNELKSKNLVDAFYQWAPHQNNYEKELFIDEVFIDPISGNMTGIVHGRVRNFYVFTLDSSLNFELSSFFKVVPWWGTRFNDQNICFELSKGKVEPPVKKSTSESKNALDYVSALNEPCLVTIINYDDYQLLFMDDKKTNVCKVVKIVR